MKSISKRGVHLLLPGRHNLPSVPMHQDKLRRAAGGGMKTKHPFPFMSGSIAASHQRKLARHPKPY